MVREDLENGVCVKYSNYSPITVTVWHRDMD